MLIFKSVFVYSLQELANSLENHVESFVIINLAGQSMHCFK